jgi:hypothetical protein
VLLQFGHFDLRILRTNGVLLGGKLGTGVLLGRKLVTGAALGFKGVILTG